MSLTNFFVTGTDTNIGKTFVSLALFTALRKAGRNAVVMKPVLSSDGSSSDDRSVILSSLKGAGVTVTEELCAALFPLSYSRPFAPFAIQGEREPEYRTKMIEGYRFLSSSFSPVIVEGIGGVLVPVEEGFFACDIARLFDIPVLFVAEDKLGVINHTLLSFEALRNRGIVVSGFIMNREKQAEEGITPNGEVIAELGKVPYLGGVIDGELKLSRAGEKIWL